MRDDDDDLLVEGPDHAQDGRTAFDADVDDLDDDLDTADAADDDLDDADDDLDDDDELDDSDDELDDSDDELDDEDDEYEDATEDEVDFVVAVYREDGELVAQALPFDLANDLEELITQLRRLPGDAGAMGVVSIDSEFFVLVRARGRQVQVLLSDGVAANDWPIARDVADFLGLEVPDPDDDAEPMGDLDILQDSGISDLDIEALTELDEDSDVVVERLMTRMSAQRAFRRALQSGTRKR